MNILLNRCRRIYRLLPRQKSYLSLISFSYEPLSATTPAPTSAYSHSFPNMNSDQIDTGTSATYATPQPYSKPPRLRHHLPPRRPHLHPLLLPPPRRNRPIQHPGTLNILEAAANTTSPSSTPPPAKSTAPPCASPSTKTTPSRGNPPTPPAKSAPTNSSKPTTTPSTSHRHRPPLQHLRTRAIRPRRHPHHHHPGPHPGSPPPRLPRHPPRLHLRR